MLYSVQLETNVSHFKEIRDSILWGPRSFGLWRRVAGWVVSDVSKYTWKVKALSCFEMLVTYHPTTQHRTSEHNNAQKHGCVTLRPRNLGSHRALFDTRLTVWYRVQIILLFPLFFTSFLFSFSILLRALIPNAFNLFYSSTLKYHGSRSNKTPSYSLSCCVSDVGLLTVVYYVNNINSCMEQHPSVYQGCLPITVRFVGLTFRHRASCILGQAFHYSPENAFCIFNQQIYFNIWYLLDRASLI